jgi:hypothetical protein
MHSGSSIDGKTASRRCFAALAQQALQQYDSITPSGRINEQKPTLELHAFPSITDCKSLASNNITLENYTVVAWVLLCRNIDGGAEGGCSIHVTTS